MGTEAEHEAMVDLFEDKIMEMFRRRIECRITLTMEPGRLTANVHLLDRGRANPSGTNAPYMFGFFSNSCPIKVVIN